MNSVHILLVEDNEGDIVLTKDALEDSKIINKISVETNGVAAIDFLKSIQNKENLPDLILLDINLPLRNGHEVLQIIKSDPLLKHIPVIMLTTSSSDKDINLSYEHHANCFITKPMVVNHFLESISSIEHFWLNIVKLPNSNKPL